MKLSEIKEILGAREIRLTKSLGQNFLHDQNQLRRIVAAAELTPEDSVLEIGPGLGALTGFLVPRAARVLAVEKDVRLAQILEARFADDSRLTIVRGDALEYVQGRDWSEWKMVSNLPYSVGSPILATLAGAPGRPRRIVATLQREVAERLVARAGDEAYGALSLVVQLHYEPCGMFRVPVTCFFPAPAVESACIALQRRACPLLPANLAPAFTRIVKRGFSQRRKKMMKLLRADWPPDRLEAGFAAATISANVRAEQVALAQFVTLTKALAGDESAAA